METEVLPWCCLYLGIESKWRTWGEGRTVFFSTLHPPEFFNVTTDVYFLYLFFFFRQFRSLSFATGDRKVAYIIHLLPDGIRCICPQTCLYPVKREPWVNTTLLAGPVWRCYLGVHSEILKGLLKTGMLLALCTQTTVQYLCVFIVLLTKASGTSLDVKVKVDRDSISSLC